MNGPTPEKTPDEIKAERTRERWKTFLTPLIYMASIVGSIAMIMAFIKSCSERFPHAS